MKEGGNNRKDQDIQYGYYDELLSPWLKLFDRKQVLAATVSLRL